MDLTQNVHEIVKSPGIDAVTASGQYHYWHYCCDGKDDRGWGCGYRTLQTMISWLIQNVPGLSSKCVPSISEIQGCLVSMGDKPGSFLDSRDWLGSVEVALVIDQLLGVPCKLVHVSPGIDQSRAIIQTLKSHLSKTGCPAMMGGDRDAASKGIFGASEGGLLVVDPHYDGKPISARELAEQGWVRWVNIEELCKHSFYNICLPQVALELKSKK